MSHRSQRLSSPPHRSIVAVALAATLTLAGAGCGGDDASTTPDDAPTDTATTEPATTEPDATDVGTLTCPTAADLAALTGLDVRELVDTTDQGPGLGRCQYLSDDPQFTTGQAMYIGLDPVDGGPSGFGTSVAGIGEWAEVEADAGVMYVGLGSGMLEIGTNAELTEDQFIAVAREALGLTG